MRSQRRRCWLSVKAAAAQACSLQASSGSARPVAAPARVPMQIGDCARRCASRAFGDRARLGPTPDPCFREWSSTGRTPGSRRRRKPRAARPRLSCRPISSVRLARSARSLIFHLPAISRRGLALGRQRNRLGWKRLVNKAVAGPKAASAARTTRLPAGPQIAALGPPRKWTGQHPDLDAGTCWRYNR